MPGLGVISSGLCRIIQLLFLHLDGLYVLEQKWDSHGYLPLVSLSDSFEGEIINGVIFKGEIL